MAKEVTSTSGDGLAVRRAAIAAAAKQFPVDKAGTTVGGGTKSSNASLGIENDVALGLSNAAASAGSTSKEMNSGASQRAASLDDNYGPQAVSARIGTQGAREDMTIGPKADRGQFGVAAGSGGHTEGSTSATLGSGARAAGTAAPTGTPGQTGSMALARKGLRSGADGSPQARISKGPADRSMVAGDKGLRTGGSGDE